MYINFIPITEEMIKLAEIDAKNLKSSIGRKTRNAIQNRDITGSLAHQAVEIKFKELKLPFKSYRLEKQILGDKGDIKYENDLIDVKGTKNIYNNQFLVFDNELESIQNKNITHFCFVCIDYCSNIAQIYGVISLSDFIKESTPVKLKWNNHAISVKYLKPFIDYAMHTNNNYNYDTNYNY